MRTSLVRTKTFVLSLMSVKDMFLIGPIISFDEQSFVRGQGAELARTYYTRAPGYSVWPTAGFIGVDLP